MMIREDPLCNDDATVLCDSRAIILIKYLLTKPRYAIRIVSVDSIIWQSWALAGPATSGRLKPYSSTLSLYYSYAKIFGLPGCGVGLVGKTGI